MNLGDGVVGGFLMGFQLNAVGESVGYPGTVGGDVMQLAPCQPQPECQRSAESEQENPREGIHSVPKTRLHRSYQGSLCYNATQPLVVAVISSILSHYLLA